MHVRYTQGSATVRPLAGAAAVLPDGTATALTGPSGSGKSTLLRVVAGLQRPERGSIVIDGKEVTLSRSGRGDPRVSLIHQDYRLIEFLDVADNLRLAAEAHGHMADSHRVAETLDVVGLSGFERRRPSTLSGGEQQRVAIARTLLTGCRVLLADEPTGALDTDNSATVSALLSELASTFGTTVLVATHDLDVADALGGRLRLIDGQLMVDERRTS